MIFFFFWAVMIQHLVISPLHHATFPLPLNTSVTWHGEFICYKHRHCASSRWGLLFSSIWKVYLGFKKWLHYDHVEKEAQIEYSRHTRA